jgi:CRP/FNR family transcriptional regulator, cyclic AMP receptor protein
MNPWLLSYLSDTEISTLRLFTQERVLQKDEVLFREGDTAVAFYIVKQGVLKAYKERSSGITILGMITENEMVGEMAFFDPTATKVRSAHVAAVEPTTVLVIMDYSIRDLASKHPQILEKITEVILKRIEMNKGK